MREVEGFADKGERGYKIPEILRMSFMYGPLQKMEKALDQHTQEISVTSELGCN